MFWVILGLVVFIGGVASAVSTNMDGEDGVYFALGAVICGALLLLFNVDTTLEDREYEVLHSTKYELVESIEDLNFNKAFYNEMIGLYIERDKVSDFDVVNIEESSYVLKEHKQYKRTFFKAGFKRTDYIFFFNEVE